MKNKPATKARKKPAPKRGKPASTSAPKRAKPASTSAPKRKPPTIVADDDTIKRAVQDLNLNRPYYTCRVVGARLEFTLYGGDLIYWPPKRTTKKRS